MHLKNSSKLVNFYAAIIILKMEENAQHFWHTTLYYLKKSKNATETKKKICAVCGEGAVIDGMCQKWFVKFLGTLDILVKILCCGAGLCIGRCLAAPRASTH